MSKFSINNPAFLQMASCIISADGMTTMAIVDDPILYIGSDFPITIQSIKNGNIIEETYESLPYDISTFSITPVNVAADAGTTIRIIGDAVALLVDSSQSNDTSVNKNNALLVLGVNNESNENIKISGSKSVTALAFMDMVGDFDFSKYPNLESILGSSFVGSATFDNAIFNNPKLKEINSGFTFQSIDFSGIPNLERMSATILSDEINFIDDNQIWQLFLGCPNCKRISIKVNSDYTSTADYRLHSGNLDFLELSYFGTLMITFNLPIKELYLHDFIEADTQGFDPTIESAAAGTLKTLKITNAENAGDPRIKLAILSVIEDMGSSEGGVLIMDNSVPYADEYADAATTKGWTVEYV